MEKELLYQLFNIHLYKSNDSVVISDANPDGIKSSLSLYGTDSGNIIYPEDIVSGSIAGNLEYTGGYIQSANFVSGTSGWKLDSNGTLTAVSATLSGTITATAGTIGGWTIGTTTISSATSGERIVLDQGNKRIDLINSSSSTVMSLRYGTGGVGDKYIIRCEPTNDDRGVMYITASTSSTVDLFDVVNTGTGRTIRLYQDRSTNTSSVLDITNNAGNATVLSILQVPSSSLSSITIDHRSDSSPAINIDASVSDDSGIEITATPVNTNTHGILINLASGSSGDALNISNLATTHLSRAVEITRTMSSTSDGSAIYIVPANSSTGICWGITIADGANAKGIDLSALGTKDYLKVAADITVAGAYKGRIPIRVGTTLQYLHYYDA